MKEEYKWNYSEFLGFLLIHASYADLEFTADEKELIQSKVGKETFEKMHAEYEELGDYEILQEILKYKGLYYPTEDRRNEVLAEINKLFKADGEFSKLEQNLSLFLTKLL
jgi:hypothetical protein